MLSEINSFLKYLETHKRSSPHTITSYRKDLEQFLAFISTQYENLKISKTTHIHIRSYLVHMMKEGITAKSINRKISSLRSFYKYLLKNKVVEANPMLKVKAPKIPKRLPEFVPKRDIARLLDEMKAATDFVSSRDQLVIRLLYYTGMRRAELLGLKDSDIDKTQRRLSVIGKGNKQRYIPISQELLSYIEDYQLIRNEELGYAGNKLICTIKGKEAYPRLIYQIVHDQLTLLSHQSKKSPHILRHSFATHMANNGAELNSVKELLGHSSLAATQVYTHNSVQQLKRVYALTHPKAKKSK